MININTDNILFICGGAFDGIEKIIAKRLNTQVIGYNNKEKKRLETHELLSYVGHQDLKRFGLIPELLGRLPVLTYLNPLGKETLRRILVEPKNALVKQYQKLFQIEGIDLTFTDEALAEIAERAINYKLGARGLRSIMEAILTDAMYESPGKKSIKNLCIDKGFVDNQLKNSNLDKHLAA